MKYKFSIIETYTCTVDLPDGVTPEDFRRGNDIPYHWNMPEDVAESVLACDEDDKKCTS